MVNTKKAVLMLCILVTSLAVVSLPNIAMGSIPTISKVQGPVSGSVASSNTLTATLSGTPTKNNVLVAVIGVKGTGEDINNLVQTGVTWYNSFQTSMTGYDLEVWTGVVTSTSAATQLTVNLVGTVTAATVDLAEYSGLNNNFISTYPHYDGYNADFQPIKASSTGVIDTRTAYTNYNNELCIAGALQNTYGQTAAGNGFTLFDGLVHNGVSLSYNQKIVSAQTGVDTTIAATGGGKDQWIAIIITLPAAPGITVAPSSSDEHTTPSTHQHGEGFNPTDHVTTTFDGTPVTLDDDNVAGDGSIDNNFNVPDKAAGTYTVHTQDSHGNSADETYTCVPHIIVTPETPGILVTVFAVALAFIVFSLVVKRKKQTAPTN